MDNIETLKALLKADEAGQELAALLNELIVDARKRNVLLVKLDAIRKEMTTLSLEMKLTKSEEAVRSVVLGESRPLTASEAAARAGDDLRSLKHTAHASAVLNSLVGKGILGKFRLGQNIYFTSPREAVNEQLKRRGESPQECSPADIAEETGMPLAIVLDAIEELME